MVQEYIALKFKLVFNELEPLSLKVYQVTVAVRKNYLSLPQVKRIKVKAKN